MNVPPAFTQWWEEHGQYVRAGGGQYEISFAFAAWQASRRAALEEAIRATVQAKTTSHACDAIRALADGDASLAKQQAEKS